MGSKQEPLKILADLAQRSRAAATGLPAQVDITPHWSGIGFQLMGQRLLAPMGEIVEMLPVPASTRLPGVQSWVRGVSNVRGRLLPMFDLEAYFGGHLSGAKHRRRVLILEMGELYSGLVVNEVYGMQHFPVDTFTETIPAGAQALRNYLLGSYVQMDMSWTVFSPFKLARDARFFNAAAA